MARDPDRPLEARRGRSAARIAALLASGALLLAAWAGIPPAVERAGMLLIRREAFRRGLTVRVAEAVFRWPGTFRLRGVDVRRADGKGLSASEVRLSWRLFGKGLLGRLSGVAVGSLVLDLPAGLTARVADSEWDVARLPDGGVSLGRKGTRQGLTLHGSGTAASRGAQGSEARIDFVSLDVGALVRFERSGAILPRPGGWTGILTARRDTAGLVSLEGLLRLEGVQVPSPVGPPASASAWGAPFDAVVAFEASVPPGGTGGTRGSDRVRFFEVPCWRIETSGVSARGSLAVALSDEDAWGDLDVAEGRLDLAAAFEASGIPRPPALASVADLGTASLSWRVSGSMSRPAEIAVTQALKFAPPPAAIKALGRYNGPFTHEALLPDGRGIPILVASGAPGFVPLEGVPPLLVRALLVSEDAGFWGHRGIDLSAIPVAAALNLREGGPLRGGSTISQQLAKNLFLSRERTYSRKLQELALTLLLEAALPKRRILEVYLNVIEWGPGLYGLRPAARHYFDKEPADLSPKEIAFLVALVPGPVKYQPSFAGGALRPGFERLVTRILAMLRSVEALTEEEYEEARAEPLAFRAGLFSPGGADVAASGEGPGDGDPNE